MEIDKNSAQYGCGLAMLIFLAGCCAAVMLGIIIAHVTWH